MASSRRIGLFFGIGLLLMLGQVQADPMVDPMRPPHVGAAAQAEAAPLALESVITSSSRRIAVINGHVLREGDHLRGHRVATIAPGRVELIQGGKRMVLELKPSIRLSQEAEER